MDRFEVVGLPWIPPCRERFDQILLTAHGGVNERRDRMEQLVDANWDLALAQSIVGPIDLALESLGEAARALGEVSEIMHRYIDVNAFGANRVGVNSVSADRAGVCIDLARQGGTEVGPAEHI
jgi:hypothetical protein